MLKKGITQVKHTMASFQCREELLWDSSNIGDFHMNETTLVKNQHLEPCMEQGSGLRKEYNKAVYCHPVYLIYVQSTSCEMPGWKS